MTWARNVGIVASMGDDADSVQVLVPAPFAHMTAREVSAALLARICGSHAPLPAGSAPKARRVLVTLPAIILEGLGRRSRILGRSVPEILGDLFYPPKENA